MLGEIARRNARFKPNELAIIFEDRVVTHGQFAERAFRLVNAMQKRGVRPGDRVAVLAQNCVEFMEAYAAGELGGWTTVTINYRLAEPEIAYILSDSKPRVLIAEAQFHDRLGQQTLALTDHVLTIGGSNTYEQALDAAEPRVPDVTVPPEETAFLMYTSGTTGRPKGVMLSHGGQMQAAFMSALDFNV
jgi:acyl-CoA synthetase (AMP-forming)/AMP-acid ligase II